MSTDLQAFAIIDLIALYDGHEQAARAFNGVYCRPNASADAVGLALEAEIERCSDMMRAIAEEAERRQPRDRGEAERKAEILIRWGLECGSWVDVANAMILDPVRADA